MKKDEVVKLIVGGRTVLRGILYQGHYGDPPDMYRLSTLAPVPDGLGYEFKAELAQPGTHPLEVRLVNSCPGCRQAWALIVPTGEG